MTEKHSPEVGDVWENDGLILYVGKLSTDENEKIIGYCYDMDKKRVCSRLLVLDGCFCK